MKVLERELVHLVDVAQVGDDEVQDGAARRRGRVGEPRRVDLLVGMTCRAS